MDWDYVDEMLHDGTPEQIMTLRCPECGKPLSYCYTTLDDSPRSRLSVRCGTHMTISWGCKDSPPNCVEYFGPEAHIDENLKLKQSA